MLATTSSALGPTKDPSPISRPGSEVSRHHRDQDPLPHLHRLRCRLVGHARQDHELEDRFDDNSSIAITPTHARIVRNIGLCRPRTNRTQRHAEPAREAAEQNRPLGDFGRVWASAAPQPLRVGDGDVDDHGDAPADEHDPHDPRQQAAVASPPKRVRRERQEHQRQQEEVAERGTLSWVSAGRGSSRTIQKNEQMRTDRNPRTDPHGRPNVGYS